MSGVTTQHPLYQARRGLRQRIRDSLHGTDAIKHRTTKYLPLPNPTYINEGNPRYKDYLKRAYYVNMPARTVRALTGLVMRKDPVMKIEPRLEYLLEDADGDGNSIEQMMTLALDEAESTGNFGLLMMAKPTDENTSRQNQDQYLPKLRLYKEEQIINWRVKNGRLVMVVLLEIEQIADPEDMFTTIYKPNYRVYYFNDAGQVVEDLYISDNNVAVQSFFADDVYNGEIVIGADSSWTVQSTTYKEMREIPFDFCGSIDTKPGFDPSPIENVVDFSLKMYIVAADEMMNVHLSSGGILTVQSNMSLEQWKEMNGGTDIDTSWGACHVGDSGSMSYVQAAESQMISSTMERLIELAIAQGAQIITPSLNDKTATEARIDQGTNISQLGQITRNVSEVFEKAVNRASAVIGGSQDNTVKLNQEFFFEKMTAQEMQAWATMVMQGMATKTDMVNDMKKGGRIAESRTADKVVAEINESGGDLSGLASAFDANM